MALMPLFRYNCPGARKLNREGWSGPLGTKDSSAVCLPVLFYCLDGCGACHAVQQTVVKFNVSPFFVGVESLGTSV